MNKHLDNYLCKKYPKIFAQRNLPMNQTCMCWGCDCGNGWFFLLDTLCESIQNHIDDPQYVEATDFRTKLKRLWNATMWNKIIYPLVKDFPINEYFRASDQFQFTYEYVPGPPTPQVEFTQVKEKFGGLRIYFNGGDEHCRSLVSFAESLSYKVCEDCGRTDELVTTCGVSWIRTTCPCCTRDTEFHKKCRNKEMIKLWDTVRNEELEEKVRRIAVDDKPVKVKVSKKRKNENQ